MDPEIPAPDTELRYDPRELRRLIGMSFSLGELVTFASQLGVPLDAPRSADDAAHAIVRAIEGRGELPALVARLERDKPLVVWPEPKPVPRRSDGQTAPEASPGPSASGSTAADPAPPPPSAADPSSKAPAEPIVDAFLTGGLDAPAPPPRPVGLVVGAVAAGVALGGVAVWLAFFRGDAAPPPEATTESPASIAVEILRGSVDGVVAACGAGADESSARGALSAAFERCSRQEAALPSRPSLPITPSPPPPPPRPTRLALPRPAPAPASGRQACLDACHDQQQACRKSRCGSEPTSASEYPQYQQCLGQCTAPAMRCRLACR